MSRKELRETIIEYSTVVLAIATIVLAGITFWTVKEAKDASFRQIGVQTWLELEKRFDSPDMLRARKKLAVQLLATPPVKNEEMSEKLFDFFEDIGAAYKAGYLDKAMADSSFSLYVTRYWVAAKSFVEEDRKHYGEADIWENFEYLAKALRQPGEDITAQKVKQMLEDESRLVVD